MIQTIPRGASAKRCPAVSRGDVSRFAGLCMLALAACLAACGGGDNDTDGAATAADSRQSALAAGKGHVGVELVQRRKAKAHDWKGVLSVAVSPDGRSIGVATSAGEVSLLDIDKARDPQSLAGPSRAAATGVLFMGAGRRLLAVSRDSVARVWNTETGHLLGSLRGAEHATRAVAASPDGKWLASVGEETRVLLWNAGTGKLGGVLSGGHTDFVNAVAFSPSGDLLASGDAEARVLVWSVAAGKLLFTLRGHADEVNTVAFSPDGRWLASAGEDAQVRLWDVATGRQNQVLQGHAGPVRALAFSADGSVLATAGQDGKVLVWNMATRQLTRTLAAAGGGAVNAVAFDSKDASLLVAGDEEGRVVQWNVDKGVQR